jgi:hypothetical protein
VIGTAFIIMRNCIASSNPDYWHADPAIRDDFLSAVIGESHDSAQLWHDVTADRLFRQQKH